MSPRRSPARRRLAALVPALVAAALFAGCGTSSDAGSAGGAGGTGAGAADTGRQVPVPTPSEHLGAPGGDGVYDDSPGWKK